MSILTAAWSGCAAASLMLALMQVFLWLHERPSPIYLLTVPAPPAQAGILGGAIGGAVIGGIIGGGRGARAGFVVGGIAGALRRR
ncbi:MAG: hypothetical protein WBM58_09605 [Sedimenticolaceae bacterium]